MSNQLRALLIKNFTLLTKQKGTLVCQIMTPVFCLGFMFLIQYLITQNIDSIAKSNNKINFLFPLNFPFFKEKVNHNKEIPIFFGECDEWYLYDFDKNTPESDKLFFGENKGDIPSMTDDGDSRDGNLYSRAYRVTNSYGMLQSQTNVFQRKCAEFRLTPFFKKTIYETEYSINDELSNILRDLSDFPLKESFFNANRMLPDGAILIHRSNFDKLSYRMQVSDNRLNKMHKGNGVTKTDLSGSSVVTMQIGALSVIDLMNKAYMKSIEPNLFVVTSVMTMPIEINQSANIERLIGFAGVIFFPMALSLLMPLFMYTIVLEKESRLVEIMKINGMKMRNYWLSLFLQNYIIYSLVITTFCIFTLLIFQFSSFLNTSWFIQFLAYAGWGLCQNGIAFFFQAFTSNAKTSTCKL